MTAITLHRPLRSGELVIMRNDGAQIRVPIHADRGGGEPELDTDRAERSLLRELIAMSKYGKKK